jgi:hypothetical protein
MQNRLKEALPRARSLDLLDRLIELGVEDVQRSSDLANE